MCVLALSPPCCGLVPQRIGSREDVEQLATEEMVAEYISTRRKELEDMVRGEGPGRGPAGGGRGALAASCPEYAHTHRGGHQLSYGHSLALLRISCIFNVATASYRLFAPAPCEAIAFMDAPGARWCLRCEARALRAAMRLT